MAVVIGEAADTEVSPYQFPPRRLLTQAPGERKILRRFDCPPERAGRVSSITLTGITWDHTRGYVPLAATAQRFHDEHPEVTIAWQTRSLKDFGDFPIEKLAERFDLIVIDHPFSGYAATHPVLVPLDTHLDETFLADQAANSVGKSYESYVYGGHLWALPIDAATPVSGHRPDLLARYDLDLPRSWDDLVALARKERLALPAAPVDIIMNLYMLCLAMDAPIFQQEGEIVGRQAGVEALDAYRELVVTAGLENLERNPIRTWEALSRGDDLVYCPFAYGYSNYGRRDYTDRPLRFGGLVELNGNRLRSTLGGTGLAISTICRHRDVALEYARYVASPECQKGLYTVTGGQPGHRQAWLDDDLNVLTNGFFRDTLQTLDEAYLRPRYPAYNRFQEDAGGMIWEFIRSGGDAGSLLDRLNARYRESLVDA
jgi:multiple sugar transport system substrate-binding protein